jgi:Tfp pilus assembly protein PilN
MPESVFAVSYTQTDDGRVNITGVSKNLTALPDFVYNLKQSGKVEKAVLSAIISRESEDGSVLDYSFTIEITPKKAGAGNENEG